MAGDLGRGGHGLGTSTGNLDLSAGDVELRGGTRVMDTKLLNSEQIIAGGDTAGDCRGVGCYAND